MKKRKFFYLVLGTNIFFVVLQIHKHSQLVKLSYTKQKTERDRDALLKQREQLTQRLNALKSPEVIKKYAQQDLGMEELSLRNVKQLPPAGVA